jgi:hypothetical protein
MEHSLLGFVQVAFPPLFYVFVDLVVGGYCFIIPRVARIDLVFF